MKLLNTCVLVIFSVTGLYSQVGISTNSPLTTLDVRGVNHEGAVTAKDGITVPRVNKLETGGTEKGQLVFLIVDDTVNNYTKGFHYWDGLKWAPLDTVKEPWYKTATTRQATSNLENIYQLGEVGIGINVTGGQLHIHNDTSRDVILSRLNNTDNNDMDLDFLRGKGTNLAPAIGVDGMNIGGIRFKVLNDLSQIISGNFESAFNPAAEIISLVDGSVSTTSSPGKIIFKTSSDGTIDTVERMVIKNDGKVGISTQLPNSTLDVKGSLGLNIRTLGSGTIANNDYTVLITGSVSLPTADATNIGRIYRIINHNSNSNVVSGTFSINGSTFSNYTLNTTNFGRGIEVQSDGSSWIILSRF